MENYFKNDFVTKKFLREHKDEIPDDVTLIKPHDLANLITYCKDSLKNPYSKELVRKAGMTEYFEKSYLLRQKRDILEQAAAKFGIRLY